LVAVVAVVYVIVLKAYVMTIKHSNQREQAVIIYKEKANGTRLARCTWSAGINPVI